MRRLSAIVASWAFSAAACAFPITYQGILRNGGAQATGTYSMVFQLTDSPIGGVLLQSIALPAVPVESGQFTVELNFNDAHFGGQERWLAVVVDGTPLAPRQHVSYAPYAIYSDRAREAGTVRVPLTLTGQNVVIEGYANAAGGTAVRGVHLAATGTAPGLLGQTNSTDAGATGILGEISSQAPGPLSAGLRGINNSTTGSGVGVHGSQNGSGWGVYGFAPTGRGVYGSTTSGIGVRAFNADSSTVAELATGSLAIRAENTATPGEGTAIEGTGGRIGVRGVAPGTGFGRDLTRIGVQGIAGEPSSGAMYLYGLFGFGQAPAEGGGRFSYGVYGLAQSGAETNTAYGVYGEAVGQGTNFAGYFQGRVHVAGTLSKSAGAFMIDHPLEPETRYLSHSFVESPEMLNIYSDVVTLDSEGNATVQLPRYFEALNRSFRYQLTPIGGAMRDLHIAEEISANSFKIGGGAPAGRVSWEVCGVRQDAAALHEPIIVEEDKPAALRGKYLNPEAFGLDKSRGIHGPPIRN